MSLKLNAKQLINYFVFYKLELITNHTEMKPILIILLGLLLFSSCKEEKQKTDLTKYISNLPITDKTKEINTFLIEKNKKLKKELENNYRDEIIQNKINVLSRKINDSYINIGADIEDSNSFQLLKQNHDLSYFTKNKDIFSFAFSYFLLDDYDFILDIAQIKWESDFESDAPLFEEFKHLWNNIDRSAERIASLYTENDKKFVYSLFSQNNYYKTSGMQCVVEALLLAHKDLEGQEEVVQSIYENAVSEEFGLIDALIDAIKSEETTAFYADKNYNDEYFMASQCEFYVYTFWARRQHEGNSDIIYSIIADFHENVKKDCP